MLAAPHTGTLVIALHRADTSPSPQGSPTTHLPGLQDFAEDDNTMVVLCCFPVGVALPLLANILHRITIINIIDTDHTHLPPRPPHTSPQPRSLVFSGSCKLS